MTAPLDDYSFDDEPSCHYPSLLVGPSLRSARLKANKRLGDVARYLGLDSSVPPRWEGHLGSTRYKPLPGKYLEPLAQFFACSVYDIAPHLQDVLPPLPSDRQAGASFTQTAMLAATDALCASTYSPSNTIVATPTISSYSMSSSIGPNPVAGTPPGELREKGQWRLICRACARMYVEQIGKRAPLACECGAALRARTQVSIASGVPAKRALAA